MFLGYGIIYIVVQELYNLLVMSRTDKKIVFNHFYGLRHDLKRSYIYSREGNLLPAEKSKINVRVNEYWTTKIHPVYAMLLSFASIPILYSKYIDYIACFLDVTREEAENIINPFLDREEPFHSHYGDVVSQFPRNVIIDADKTSILPLVYTPEEFRFDSVDLQQERSFRSPSTVVFMSNNTCTTNCVYCYADKTSGHLQMSFDQVRSILKDCYDLRIGEFMITGGDIFVYKHWRELLNCMKGYNMNIGLLSTKTPLQEKDVRLLKDYQVNMQFSLDAVSPSILKEVVGMNPDYLLKVRDTFALFDKYKLRYKITTVLTKINDSVSNILDLYEFLQQFQCVAHWEVRIAHKSLYSKCDFEKLKITKESIQQIDESIQKIKEHSRFKISWEPVDRKHYFQAKQGSRSFKGSRCSANYSNMMVLPDGKVTICEQLYWNPNYIIGDLTKQSISEVWNSPRALALAFPRREDFRDVSPCKKCKIFEECYNFPNRCIVDVLKGYGEENADFPDPRCIDAPAFISELRPE